MHAKDFTLAQLPAWFTSSIFSEGKTHFSIATIVGLLVLVVLFWFGAKVLESFLRKIADRTPHFSETSGNIYTWARILRYLIWVSGTFAALSYLGIDLTGFAIIGGAIGVGVGLGLQNIVANFISGIILLLERTLKIGDFVELQSGVCGHVREISLRFTRITTNDDVDIIVPNSEFTQNRLVNWTYRGRKQRLHVPFGVAYGSDKEKVKAAALRAATHVPGVLVEPERPPEVWLVKFGDNSLDFELVLWVGSDLVSSPGKTQAKLLWALHTELCAEGIEIPFPQRDLYLKSGAIDVTIRQPDASDQPK